MYEGLKEFWNISKLIFHLVKQRNILLNPETISLKEQTWDVIEFIEKFSIILFAMLLEYNERKTIYFLCTNMKQMWKKA